ncbi:MAG: molybdopterin synthase catalytic subunit MoaE [Gammaproteobacteria bacterium]|nr:molybdopterin synthase catalytic subunit MoaE [Pseudomonadales bacterium]MCP5346183.1 molybdopterin synthase catalytic subunit MoaE [Pseudomonadales bacterium]
MRYIAVQQEDFDVGDEARRLREIASNVGAICTFSGLVREFQQDAGNRAVSELFLEHYPGMTEKSLEEIVDQACARWQLIGCRVIHRVGALHPGDQIVFVGSASEHRQDAFESAQFIMDYLKTRAPFWKRQSGEEGSQWVEHRDSDELAAERWRS